MEKDAFRTTNSITESVTRPANTLKLHSACCRKPGTDTKFPAQFAGNWLSVPGFAPWDMLPVRRAPKTVKHLRLARVHWREAASLRRDVFEALAYQTLTSSNASQYWMD